MARTPLSILRIPRLPRRGTIAYAHDVVAAALAFVLAFWFRVGDALDLYWQIGVLGDGVVFFTIIAAVVFLASSLYRGVWRYASLEDALQIVRAVTISVVVFVALMFVATRLSEVPRSLPPIIWLVLVAMLTAPRAIYRIYKDRGVDRILARTGTPRVPVLVVGAHDEAEIFIRSVQGAPDSEYRIVGALDEKGGRIGRRIHGVEVMGGIGDAGPVIERLRRRGEKPKRLVIVRPALAGKDVRDLLDVASRHGIALARTPRLTDFSLETGEVRRLEPRPIALEDLLGRSQAMLDQEAMARLVAGKRVLVTGAGGSIGSELVRQIARLRPAEIALVEQGEFALYGIDGELARHYPTLPRRAVIADVRDRARVDTVVAAFRPDLVFHAAALKHVPLVEANPLEGIATNVLGARNVADAACRYGVSTVVMISTDKAVNPASVMGATKRLAETWCQALDKAARENGGPNGTRFATVRFGNVLGSTGSVVPLFQRQLAEGGPLTVTHPDVKRWFMTTREAVELVLAAAALRLDEERAGHIYVLDMGEPVRIADLARQMIRLAGLEPDRDIEIAYTGLRPGERLEEELFHQGEPLAVTGHAQIMLAEPRTVDRALLEESLDMLAEAIRAGDEDRAIALLSKLVPEFAAAPSSLAATPALPPAAPASTRPSTRATGVPR